jgi:hypothetical protein
VWNADALAGILGSNQSTLGGNMSLKILGPLYLKASWRIPNIS